MGGTGNRAVLMLHKCNAAMIWLKILFVYNIFHIFEYRFEHSPANLFSRSFGDSQHQRSSKNEAISEGVGVAFRGVFPEALCKIGELLKSNSCSVEQAVSYFRRSFIYGLLNVFLNNTNFSTEAHVPFSSLEPVVSWPLVGYKLSQGALGTRMHTYQLRGMVSTV